MTTTTQRLVMGLALALVCVLEPAASQSAARDGSVTGTVKILKGGKHRPDATKVVVYLRDVRVDPRAAKPKHVIRQKNLQFEPRINVVVKGTVVEFPNEDKIFHNVFSTSRPARFDLGLYRSGASKSVELKRDGVVDVFCNIHPEMVSRVLIVPTGHFAVAEPDGKFRIDDVPPGTYPVVAWPAYGEVREGTVTVAAGKPTTIDLEVKAGDRPTQHLRKDGTPYGRYE